MWLYWALLLVIPVVSSSWQFDPSARTLLDHYGCGSEYEYPDYTVPDTAPNKCRPGTSAPRILVMEIEERFFESLTGGTNSHLAEGLLSRRGEFHTSGSCFEFVAVDKKVDEDDLPRVITSLLKSGDLNKVLFIVDYDLVEELTTSIVLKTLMKINTFLFGDDLFHHMMMVIGHPFDGQGPSIEREVAEKLKEVFWKGLSLDVQPRSMSNRAGFYSNLLKDPIISQELRSNPIPVTRLQEGKDPFLYSSGKLMMNEELFTVSGFFAWPEGSNWAVEWLVSDDVLFRVEGHTSRTTREDQRSLANVLEASQTVEHVSGSLYAVTLQINATVHQPGDVSIALAIEQNPPDGPRHHSIVVQTNKWDSWGSWTNCGRNIKKRRTRTTPDHKASTTIEVACDITGISHPNFCRSFPFPSPRILLLGATGVGKSTLGNLLFGVNKGSCEQKGRRKCIRCNKNFCKPGQCLEKDPNDGQCTKCKPGQCQLRRGGACAEKECLVRHNYKLGEKMPDQEPLPFEPGGGIDSKTVLTKPYSNQFLGVGPCFTLIDTPGAADTKGRDYKHAIDMATMLKDELGTLDVILITFNGSVRRFSQHTLALLKLYEEIFGKEMWQNVVVEMSFWGHKESEACQRKEDMDELDELRQASELQSKFKELFDVDVVVPVVFIDPVLKVFHPVGHKLFKKVETREKDFFRNMTTSLWARANAMAPYECTANCKAPSNFYIGEPWIKMDNKNIEIGQLNLEIPCKIWDGAGGGGDKNSDELKWFFKPETEENEPTEYELLFTKELNQAPITIHRALESHGLRLTRPTTARGSFFAISKVIIDRVSGDRHKGTYKCENRHGHSEWTLNIPYWSQWGHWTSCTKTCKIYPKGQPGTRQRVRVCKGHVDATTTCSRSGGGEQEDKPCTGDLGGSEVFCPVAPVLSEWTHWSPCSKACEGGETKTFRNCKQGLFGTHLQNQCPTKDNKANEEEKKVCNSHDCDKSCEWDEWPVNWSPCSQTCSSPSSPSGTMTRTRKVKEKAKGGGVTCNEEDGVETQTCGTSPNCPIDGQWSAWAKSGKCFNTKGCGAGKQVMERDCEGVVGTGRLCTTRTGHDANYERKETGCTMPVANCPVDCKMTPWVFMYVYENCPTCGPHPNAWPWWKNDNYYDCIKHTCRCLARGETYRTRRIVVREKYNGKQCGNTKENAKPNEGARKALMAATCCGCPRTGGCYSTSSLVTLKGGEVVKMADLKIGDMVQVVDTSGHQDVSSFVGWTEKLDTDDFLFYKLRGESGNLLIMTGNHGLFIWKNDVVVTTFARDLVVGDLLVVSQPSNSSQVDRLVEITQTIETGALGPLTLSGTIIVNNISTSCYASYPHWLAHIALLPARLWPRLFLDDEISQLKAGTRKYIINIKWLGRLFHPAGFRIDSKHTLEQWPMTGPIALSSLLAGVGIFVMMKNRMM